jgi:protein involved in polysaccharide export with SLBB domain
VSVAKKTCKQLAQELKEILEKEYYYRASVVLSIDSVSKMRGKIYIYGQVKAPGSIELPTEENFTVAKAILRAGGFGEFADKKGVTVFHTTPEGVKQKTVLNMQEIFEQGKNEKDVILQDEDSVLVPEKRFNF